MKREYIKPETDIVKIEMENMILQSSGEIKVPIDEDEYIDQMGTDFDNRETPDF